MRAVKIEPGKEAIVINIENSLEALQQAVGGYIECFTIATNAAIICDEEGRLKGKERCCKICGVELVGTVLIVGVDGEELCDLTPGFVQLLTDIRGRRARDDER